MGNLAIIKIGGTSIKARQKSIKESYQFTGDQLIEQLKKHNKIVCVCSAFGDRTDILTSRAYDLSHFPDQSALDFLLTVGEQESVALLAIYLLSKGVKCQFLTAFQAGIQTSSDFGNASILSINARQIHSHLINNDVVLITGFQGVTPDGRYTTLGRGGSDTTAIAMAAALDGDVCEIVSDVIGIHTTNPAITPEAILIEEIDFDLTLEMASAGAEVIDCRAIDLARACNVSFSIRHYRNHTERQTTVSKLATPDIRALVPNSKCTMMKISIEKNSSGQFAKIYDFVKSFKLRIGLVSQTVDTDEQKATISILLWESPKNTPEIIEDKLLSEVEAVSHVERVPCSAISIIGKSLMQKPGTMQSCLKQIRDVGLNVLGVSTSRYRITVLFEDNQEKTKLKEITDKLHEHLDTL